MGIQGRSARAGGKVLCSVCTSGVEPVKRIPLDGDLHTNPVKEPKGEFLLAAECQYKRMARAPMEFMLKSGVFRAYTLRNFTSFGNGDASILICQENGCSNAVAEIKKQAATRYRLIPLLTLAA